MRRTVRAVAGLAAVAGAGAAAVWIRRRHQAIAKVEPELRDPLMWLPLSIANGPTLRLARLLFERPTEPVAEVEVTEQVVPADGAGIRAFVYRPKGWSAPGPAVLWIHGGGTVLGSAAADHALASRLARDSGVLVVSVDYRLAPEHPFPTPFADCCAALAWMHDQATALGIDRTRVGVGGASAGGLLAASVCQWAVDNELPVAFQLLVYPMLDDRTITGADHDGRGVFVWTPTSNAFAWRAYLGEGAGLAPSAPYAVPARRADLAGLPPTWIGVGDLDLFFTEDLAYAAALRDAGVPVEVHIEPRMHHGADDRLYEVSPMMRAWRARIAAALREGLAGR